MADRAAHPPPTRALIVMSFLAVWLVWGTTYLGIRVALEAIPPLAMASARFLLAGALMFGLGRMRGAPRPTFAQWRNSAWLGVLFFAVGNGAVVWAEQRLASGTAALLITAEPVVITVLARRRPSAVEAIGMALASLGVAALVGSFANAPTADLTSALLVILGCVGWAVASVQSPRLDLPASASIAAGMQMIGGGLALAMMAALHDEGRSLSELHVTARAGVAFAYLVGFGSIVAFTAYQFLARTMRPALVATYAYVNPVVAVLVGAMVLGEPLTARMLAAGAATIGGVFLITAGPSLVAAYRSSIPKEVP